MSEPQSTTPSTRKAVRSYVMRKFHEGKRSEASGKAKDRGVSLISTGTLGTQDATTSTSEPQGFNEAERLSRTLAESNQIDTRVVKSQLTNMDKALSAELSANYFPSFPGSVLMIIEPVPPLVTKFPVPQESMRHVHFCKFRLRRGVAPNTMGANATTNLFGQTRLILRSHYNGQQILGANNTKCSK